MCEGMGGGIVFYISEGVKIINTTFINNKAKFKGGGIFFFSSNNIIIKNNKLERNYA